MIGKAEQEALYAELLTINHKLGEDNSPQEIATLLERREFLLPYLDRRRGYTFECENCESLEGSTLDNDWWRCNRCGFPSK